VTPFVGIAECTVNLLLLFVSILLPIWSLTELEAGTLAPGLSGMKVVNVLLTGTAMVLSFHRHQAAAMRSVAGKPRG
jgi:hypothetical protein